MATNNPAGRLLELMAVARKIPKNVNGGDAWRQVLSDEDEESLELDSLLERLSRVVVLPAAIRRDVTSVEGINHDLYLRHMGVWERAFSSRIRFDAQWSHFMELFNGEHFYSLETCDELLAREKPEAVLSPEFVAEIASEFDEMRHRIVEADLDDELRAFLLAGLDRMREALRHYRFSGIPPVIEALEASIGAAQLQPEVTRRSNETELGKQYWSGMGRVYAHVREEWHPYRAIKGAVVDILALPSGP